MPTLLGPTNYPPLEAAALGTVTLNSDVHQFDLGPWAYFQKIPVENPSAWAEAMAMAIRVPRNLVSCDLRSLDVGQKVAPFLRSFI